jgi:hypothetical protein
VESITETEGEEGSPDERLRDLEAQRILSEERIQDLERRLDEAEKERQSAVEELEETLTTLRRVSDPEQRLRAGIELFNASQHTRTVSSISKALGLPEVHAGIDDVNGGKPVLSFIWGDMDWHRYVADPTEGVEEPRVYLIGTGNEPGDLRSRGWNPNARMDAKGLLKLGVQAR